MLRRAELFVVFYGRPVQYQDDLRQKIADLQSDHNLLQQEYLCH